MCVHMCAASVSMDALNVRHIRHITHNKLVRTNKIVKEIEKSHWIKKRILGWSWSWSLWRSNERVPPESDTKLWKKANNSNNRNTILMMQVCTRGFTFVFHVCACLASHLWYVRHSTVLYSPTTTKHNAKWTVIYIVVLSWNGYKMKWNIFFSMGDIRRQTPKPME